MEYWLLKSEPDVYGIDNLKKDKIEPWNGVRNYKARNYMKSMKRKDRGFFYHSNAKPSGIIGICEIIREHYPDPTQFDPKSPHYDPKSSPDNPRWYCVDVKFIKKFPRILSLKEIQLDSLLQQMTVAKKGNRLSITPVKEEEWERILTLLQ